MSLPVWNAHEPDVTTVPPSDDRHADAISARGWHTPPGVSQRWRGRAVVASGRRTPGHDLSLAGEEFARIVFELLWSEGSFGGTDVSGGRPLACVWSSLDGCSCGASIPIDAVTHAWARALDTTGELQDRFFQFIWEGGVWAAYGLADGEVRGVQCPSHNSERAARSHAARFGEGLGAGEIVCELALAG